MVKAPRLQTDTLKVALPKRRILAAIVLILLSDFLFYDQVLGVSAPIFAALLFCLIVWTRQRPNSVGKSAIVMVLACLPALEFIQPLSLVFLGAGLLIATVWLSIGDRTSITQQLVSAIRLANNIPFTGLRDFINHRKNPRPEVDITGSFKRFRAEWSLPIIGAVVLLGLMAVANPIYESWVSVFWTFDFDIGNQLSHLALWIITGLAVWPFLGRYRQTKSTLWQCDLTEKSSVPSGGVIPDGSAG